MKEILIILLVAPLAVATVNSLLNRLTQIHVHRTPFVAGFVVAVFWGPTYLFACSATFGFSLGSLFFDFVYGLAYLICVIFLNWFVFTLTDVSMHIQLLLKIFAHPNISRRDLLAKYNKDVIISNRIPRLIELGQLELRDGKLFTIGRSVIFGASICLALRYILGLPLRPEDAQHNI